MNVGLLTGGGDCPGLNAVIRAVVQRIVQRGRLRASASSKAGAAWSRTMTVALGLGETDGIIGQGGTILGSSRTNPYKNPDTDLAALRANFARARPRRPGRHRRRRHAGRRRPPPQRFPAADRRHPQDHRQRPAGDRLLLRLRHRRQRRDRGRRPAPDHDREPPPDHGRRDDGPPLRLDRLLRRASPWGPTTSSSPRSPSTCPT